MDRRWVVICLSPVCFYKGMKGIYKMLNLKIDYDSIATATIPEMKRYEQELQELSGHMEKTIESLGNYMEAESANAYYVEFVEVISVDIKKMEEMVAEYRRQLQQVLEQFESTDYTVANMIKV